MAQPALHSCQVYENGRLPVICFVSSRTEGLHPGCLGVCTSRCHLGFRRRLPLPEGLCVALSGVCSCCGAPRRNCDLGQMIKTMRI